MIQALIIDDEKDCIDDLLYLIDKNNLPISVIATASSANDGLVKILKHNPDLVFLDVVMPGMTGFEMLELIPEITFNLIITTSKDKYAIQAIRSSAIDFLLKPIKLTELTNSIERVNQKPAVTYKKQIQLLSESMQEPQQAIKRIALVVKDGVQLVAYDKIEYFHSEGNYTHVHLSDEATILVSKPIGRFEETVQNSSFFRVHNSYLVNLNHVEKYIRSDGGYIVMKSKATIPVSRSKKDDFFKSLGYM